MDTIATADSKSVRLGIAGITLELVSEGYKWKLPEVYQRFVASNGGAPAQVLRVRDDPFPSLQLEKTVFQAGSTGWTMHADAEGRAVLDMPGSALRGYARRLAVFTSDFRSAQVYAQHSNPQPKGSPGPFPLEYPLDRFAVLSLLAQGHGVMLHAAAVVDRGKAIILTGPSGAGKSTLARLYSDRDGVTVLSDDTIVLRQIGGEFWAFGTPWHSSTPLCSPLGAPISRIYAIAHASENVLRPIEQVDAAKMLLTRTVIPFHHPSGVEFTLDFVAEMSEKIQCYRLGFVPDAGAVSFIRQMERGSAPDARDSGNPM